MITAKVKVTQRVTLVKEVEVDVESYDDIEQAARNAVPMSLSDDFDDYEDFDDYDTEILSYEEEEDA